MDSGSTCLWAFGVMGPLNHPRPWEALSAATCWVGALGAASSPGTCIVLRKWARPSVSAQSFCGNQGPRPEVRFQPQEASPGESPAGKPPGGYQTQDRSSPARWSSVTIYTSSEVSTRPAG